MTDLLDLGKRLDRAAYDVAKSLVKLDEVQRHAEMSIERAKAETQTALTNVRIILGQIERLEVLVDSQSSATPLQAS